MSNATATAYQCTNVTGTVSTAPTDGDIWSVDTKEYVRAGHYLTNTEYYVVTGVHQRKAGTAIYLTHVPSVDMCPATGRGYDRGKWVAPDMDKAYAICDGVYKYSPTGKSDKRRIVHQGGTGWYCYVPSESGSFSQLKPATPVEDNPRSLVARPVTDSGAWVSAYTPAPKAA